MPRNPAAPQPSTIEGRLADRVAQLESQVRSLLGLLGQIPVVDTLPSAGRPGRAVVLSSDSKLYIDTGTAWNPQT